MFDVSFSELVLILIVGLVVFGPEKLPEVVRTAGLWLNKLRRSFNHIRSEIEREVGMEELKRDIHNQGIMDSLKEVHNDLRNDLNKAQQELSQIPHDINRSIETHSGHTNANTATNAATSANNSHSESHSTVPMEPFPEATPTSGAPGQLADSQPNRDRLVEPERYHRPS